MKQRPIETFPSRSSTVSRGVYFAPPHIFDFIKNLHKMLHKQFFIITLQNNFFLACFDWSRAFNFRIYFDFWWKTYTKRCTNKFVLKDFVRLHFTVDQMLSISEYDWENGRIRVSKTMPLEIVILILFRFCLLCWLSLKQDYWLVNSVSPWLER